MGIPLAFSNSSQTLVQDEPDAELSTRTASQTDTFEEGYVSADDSDDEENDGYEHYKEWHGDHWDEVDYFSRWKDWDIGDGWPHNFMRSDELSKPNDQLLERPMHRHWLQKLSGMRRKDLPSLKVWAKGIPKIPLENIVQGEDTDYLVAIDAGHEDIPVWLIVSQSSLRDRAEFNGKDHPQLPVFKGLLKDGSYGYDTACILRSIRDIAGPTNFEDVCELVRKTRAVADPGILDVEEKKMAEVSGTTLPEDWYKVKSDEEIPPPPPKEIVDDHLGFDSADLIRASSF
ncbi:hypothetical protein INS49_010574 [Diaporthe citri]|uniref:uncharacterized protein n=1 Tax=Diaporthe citri TaxID=83186 RepID=UPI001C8083FE|nr:uncharacterized protein INS49_010574 [Diaporthe citri]KAG6362344.1 hypothetical protein INS49_010574 [Diaporthe citri]